ncbi:Mob1/phocein [Sporormia fimetaria CBS 119925]|uniref:Mob1/phocein n=1 Tax=Sporormia fimetaria CBS 119925 TaxID=1340428 RepID=A0A6A6UYS5_9PLEO|nr:Mob1/phocein [Sporormia fimetaria CBS 119925]
MATPASPSSSPRLPSPPPIVEDQLGPKSPSINTEENQKFTTSLEHAAARRIRPGSKAADMAEGPPLLELTEVDSAFQLTEHLKALHHHLTHDANGTIAVDKEVAHKLAQPPENVDKTLWLYELCRFLTQHLNKIIVALFTDDPPCSSNTCPEMRASEWQYLCAVHDPPKSCCAIDYCCHTLDWAANTLTSSKTFPSRLAMGTDQNSQHQQMRHLTNIFRRLYRIFAHAWFQHRDVFWKVESSTGLYVFFKTVCDDYGLIPEDNYTIPPEAEGEEARLADAPPVILTREASGPQQSTAMSAMESEGDHTLSTAGTTKRHRHSPSVGANPVSTVVEEAEEEEEADRSDDGEVSVIHVEEEQEAQAQTSQEGAEEDKEASGEETAESAPEAEEDTKAARAENQASEGQKDEGSPERKEEASEEQKGQHSEAQAGTAERAEAKSPPPPKASTAGETTSEDKKSDEVDES